MELRRFQEELEEKILGEYAAKSSRTRGRERPEEKCDIRTDFQRDRDRIIHCKSFRRMKHKTQVFISPEGDHYRTRLTHTLEVSQIARSIARALRLNEDLTEAIALGHDLGHTPFGHAGERKLDELCRDTGGFAHNVQSLRVVERLEKDGRGLNLTWEVRDGILNHRTSGSFPIRLLIRTTILTMPSAQACSSRRISQGILLRASAHAPAAASMPWCGIPFFTAWASTISA